MKRLPAFTLIEGIVAMVLLSLIFSTAVLVSFRLYQGLAPVHELQLDAWLQQQMDSVVLLPPSNRLAFGSGDLSCVCFTEPLDRFSQSSVLTCTATDSLGYSVSGQRIIHFYAD